MHNIEVNVSKELGETTYITKLDNGTMTYTVNGTTKSVSIK